MATKFGTQEKKCIPKNETEGDRPEDKSHVADLTFDLSYEASQLLGLAIEEYSHSIGERNDKLSHRKK